MKVSVVRPHELGGAEVTAWGEIQEQERELASPFLAPAFALSAGRVREPARVAILEEDGRTTGFFAFERRRGAIGKPLAAGVSDQQAVIRRSAEQLDPLALLRGCGLASWEFDHLVAGQLPLANRGAVARPSPIIDLSHGYDAFVRDGRTRSSTFKKTLARLRRLEADLGPVRLVFDERDPEAFETLLRWKAAQYVRTGRTNRVNVGWVSHLLRDLFAARDASCSGTLSALYAGDRMVAGHFGLRSARCLAWWFPAYDPTLARYAPGLCLLLRTTEDAANRGLAYIDLGKGQEPFKLAVANGEHIVGEGWIASRSAAAAAHGLIRGPRQAAYNLIMTQPALHGAARRVLRGFGRLRTRHR